MTTTELQKHVNTDDHHHGDDDGYGEEDSHKEQVKFIKACTGKNFVFLFGTPAAGKTVVVGSLLFSMQRPEVKGSLHILGSAKSNSYYKKGLALYDRIQTAFNEMRFPPRTTAGEVIQILTQYKFSDGDLLDIVFLEMAGEDLRSVRVTCGGDRELPIHISSFFQIHDIKMTFLLTVSWEKAGSEDGIINAFLQYLHENAPKLSNESKIILLVTQWDTYPKRNNVSASDFVHDNMPQTFNMIAASNNRIQEFSIGSVFVQGNDQVIQYINYEQGQRLFGRLIETFTGRSTERIAPKQSWWSRLFS